MKVPVILHASRSIGMAVASNTDAMRLKIVMEISSLLRAIDSGRDGDKG